MAKKKQLQEELTEVARLEAELAERDRQIRELREQMAMSGRGMMDDDSDQGVLKVRQTVVSLLRKLDREG